MSSSGINGVTNNALRYVQSALLPDQSSAEASASFTRMIDASLKSWFTQFNFFMHNVAQMRFSGDQGESTTLSFIPKNYR